MEGVAFPRVKTEFSKALTVDNCVALKGKVSIRNGEKTIVVDKVKVV